MACKSGPNVEVDGMAYAIDASNIKQNKKLVYNTNLLNYSTWTVGTGSATGFGANQSSTENYRLIGTDPFGHQSIIWEARPDSTSGADGGWNTTQFSVDQSKMYRFSVWIRRTVLGNGSYYFGLYAYNASGSNVGVTSRSSTSANTNYYWRYASGNEILSTTEWFLLVGHVYPYGSGTGASHPDSGLFKRDGTKIASFTDAVWVSGTTKASHRTYLYYSTDTATRQQWSQPRVDLCDGNEISVKDILNNTSNNLVNIVSGTTTCVIKNQVTTSTSTIGNTKSLLFNNSTNYIAMPSNMGYTTYLSVFAWIKINGTPKGGYHIVCGGQECEISIPTAGELRVGVVCGTTRYVSNHGSGLADGKWHHVGFTVGNNVKTAYIDGVVVGTQSISGTLVYNVPNRAIGQYGLDTTYAMNGEISNFRIYNKVLSSSVIKLNYLAHKYKFV